MTATQKAKAIRLLKKDCQISGRFIDYKGRTCALGCLALAAGVPKSRLRKLGFGGIYGDCFISAKIESSFGLTLDQQSTIQYRNDSYDEVPTRRQHVIGYVNTL